MATFRPFQGRGSLRGGHLPTPDPGASKHRRRNIFPQASHWFRWRVTSSHMGIDGGPGGRLATFFHRHRNILPQAPQHFSTGTATFSHRRCNNQGALARPPPPPPTKRTGEAPGRRPGGRQKKPRSPPNGTPEGDLKNPQTSWTATRERKFRPPRPYNSPIFGANMVSRSAVSPSPLQHNHETPQE